MIPKTERLSADVLILGGGLAGCMGAVAAIKKGCTVILADTAAAERVLSPPAISSITTLSRTTCTNGWNGGIRPETACSIPNGWNGTARTYTS